MNEILRRVASLALPTPRQPTCLHDDHISYDGRRLGVLVVDEHHASLLPCALVNKDGR